ncbi:recombinase family protein [Pedobacter frigoris]|uniref:Recombinase family protein n=1 Tax=Pedobacter frigoris TaxID=2571272 RepID=A0A4U1CCJ8_9SPHI|nr:recombinase family protein [Pedobacter frigoris]TKC04465.1 recombinase family protein [Pedobacter frigoris]
MKTADLYIRVSTDEQADKGYSQRDQEERLRKYCDINCIAINKVVFEDHSAKTFNRPQWIKLLADIKRSKGQRNLILFTKWDRFSRNTGDAYGMIAILRKYGVEPQGVEQPLDLSVPENKMMLAFYLAAPEVENDRRALNTFNGMRRAKKEGRWMSTAPTGYKNFITLDGRKYIAPNEPKASLMRWVFKEIAKDNYAADQIRKMANEKGLQCPRMNFYRLVRNPVYCGKIMIPQHKDEDFKVVDGQHDALISEALFYDVQDVLNGRKRKKAAKVVSLDSLPLRGLILCPNCHRMLTGSKSKGKNKHYYYYHCVNECGTRFNALEANDLFLDQLKEFTINPSAIELVTAVITSVYKSRTLNDFNDKKLILADIEKQNVKMSRARTLLLDGDIEPSDFKAIKADCEALISRLEARMGNLQDKPLVKIGVDKLVDKVITCLLKLDKLYINAEVDDKRRIVCALYPEKLQFDGSTYRTPRPNGVIEVIALINSQLEGIKKGKEAQFEPLSLIVARRGIEPLFPE